MTRLSIDLFVLDTLANDLEAIEDILRMLNSHTELGWRDQHPDPFVREEVVPALLRGIQRGDIEACIWSDRDRALVGAGPGTIPSGSLDDVWFRLTGRGRLVLNAWEPPPLPGSDSPV